MNNEDSTIRSLHELKTLFDSGAITPEEYESVKKRIIYGTIEANASESQPDQPASESSSPNSVKPIETRVIYPSSQPENPESPLLPPPVTEENSDDIESAINVEPAKKKDWLLVSLAVIGALLLIGLIAYQFFDKPDSERLTSKSGPDTEQMLPADTTSTLAAAPTAPESATSNQSDSIATITGADTAAVSNQEIPVTSSGPLPSEVLGQPAGLLTDKNQIISRASEQLNAYYTDMQAAPFDADTYFAPQVERYYTLTNTTPAAITENINTYHFPEFINGQTSIQEGSLEVVNSGNNSYELTYLENGSALRKSKNQKQETKAAVRVKFNLDFKITFFRQEQLLENKFTDE